MRMTPEGLVNWHPEGGIRNANVPECYNHIICALKNGKKHIMRIIIFKRNINWERLRELICNQSAVCSCKMYSYFLEESLMFGGG